MSEWIDISVYDNLKKKPANCVFFFKAEINESRPYASLSAIVEKSRNYGNRVCTHYIELPEFPKD